MGLFGDNKELQFRTCDLKANHKQIQRNKKEGNTLLWTWKELL